MDIEKEIKSFNALRRKIEEVEYPTLEGLSSAILSLIDKSKKLTEFGVSNLDKERPLVKRENISLLNKLFLKAGKPGIDNGEL